MSEPLSKQTKVTLGAAGSAIAFFVGTGITVGVMFTSMRNDDREQAEADRAAAARQNEEVKTEIRAIKTELVERDNATDRRIAELERKSADRWSAPMMEIWVLRSRESGVLADPAPIIERYSP